MRRNVARFSGWRNALSRSAYLFRPQSVRRDSLFARPHGDTPFSSGGSARHPSLGVGQSLSRRGLLPSRSGDESNIVRQPRSSIAGTARRYGAAFLVANGEAMRRGRRADLNQFRATSPATSAKSVVLQGFGTNRVPGTGVTST